MYQSDKTFSKNIIVAAGALYSKRYRQKVLQALFVIERVMPELRKTLKIPRDVVVRVAFSKSRRTYGRYFNGEKVAEIDPRRDNIFKVVSTLAHEMVHAQQYHTKKLKRDYISTTHSSLVCAHYWEGKLVLKGGPSSYEKYRNLPWEKEAFDLQDGLARYALKAIGMEKFCE